MRKDPVLATFAIGAFALFFGGLSFLGTLIFGAHGGGVLWLYSAGCTAWVCLLEANGATLLWQLGACSIFVWAIYGAFGMIGPRHWSSETRIAIVACVHFMSAGVFHLLFGA